MRECVSETERENSLRLEHQLCFPLYAATNMIQRLYRPLLAPLGLTYAQYLVLLLLWERSSATVGELRECLHLDPGTITPLLKRMEAAGFLKRRRSQDDERRVIVEPTECAVALRSDAAHIPASLGARLGMDSAHGEQLYHLTTKLVESLTEALGKLRTDIPQNTKESR